MTFVNESCFATVLSCTVNGFPSGIRRRNSLPSRRTTCFKAFDVFFKSRWNSRSCINLTKSKTCFRLRAYTPYNGAYILFVGFVVIFLGNRKFVYHIFCFSFFLLHNIVLRYFCNTGNSYSCTEINQLNAL